MGRTSRVEIGTRAPALDLPGGPSSRALHGSPFVLAFARRWSPAEEDAEALETIRAQLRGLGASLIVLSQSGVWSFRADDDVELCAPASREVDVAVARVVIEYGVDWHDERAPALFVVDAGGVVGLVREGSALEGELPAKLAGALEAAGSAMLHVTSRGLEVSRRDLIMASLAAGFACALGLGCEPKRRKPEDTHTTTLTSAPAPTDITLNVNGQPRLVKVDPRTTVLDALRERLALTGTKKGCDQGQCGACTVIVDGRRVLSCLTLAVTAQGKAITTVEGLASGDRLHPMQAAFIAEDAFQCGFCTPGQIMGAVALVREGRAKTDDEVRDAMSGNICRCGAYPNIVRAIQSARKVGA